MERRDFVLEHHQLLNNENHSAQPENMQVLEQIFLFQTPFNALYYFIKLLCGKV